jgi:hypothetical protein
VKNRVYVAIVFGGVAVIFVVVALILHAGLEDPSPPWLPDNPRVEIPGMIAYSDWDQCIRRVDASGAGKEQKFCPSFRGEIGQLAWVDANTMVYVTYGPAVSTWSKLDWITMTATAVPGAAARIFEPQDPVSIRGERASIGRDGSVYRGNGEMVRIYEFSADSNRPFPEILTWSPDGEWLLVRYPADSELWIIRRDGSVAGSFAEEAAQTASWWIPGSGVAPKVDLPAGFSLAK